MHTDIVDVYAPAEGAISMRVRLPRSAVAALSYSVPTHYSLGSYGPVPPDGPITIEVQWQDSVSAGRRRTRPRLCSTGPHQPSSRR